MLTDAILDLAVQHGLDPEVVADFVTLLQDAEPTNDRHLRRVRQLGVGATAEVWEVDDTQLGRRVAMKILRPELAVNEGFRERFLREARATAQLVHPGIVPIHQIGTLADGRPWFTMAVVRGRTFAEILESTERGSAELRRRVDLFRRAVDAVAYAHDRGVLHRDLKPANIMVGRFGTVFVLDWGLVRTTHLPGSPPSESVATLQLPAAGTRVGSVTGTPGYLSPEQARGEPLTPASDVFSLGAVLYELLHDEPAFDVHTPEHAIDAAQLRQIPDASRGPEPLRRLVDAAMAADPTVRPANAGILREALGRWLDGEAQRELALQKVKEAEELLVNEDTLRQRAMADKAKLKATLSAMPTWAAVEKRAPLWRQSDEIEGRLAEADELRRSRLLALHGALTLDAECPEALEALAAHWRREHGRAERANDKPAARDAAAQLRHFDRGQHAPYLAGSGTLELATEPPGVRATLYRYVEENRVLRPVDPVDLGLTPISRRDLPMGRYLITLADDPGIRYPVWISRNHHWTGPVVQRLRPGALGPDDCYVPAGPAMQGTPDTTLQALPGRLVPVDAFIAKRYCVTHAEYIAFLDDLVDQGRESEALKAAPRERGTRPDIPGPLCYRRDDAGHFHLAPDADGDIWEADWPVFQVDYHGAAAYAAWFAARSRRPWRLPREEEWEKAGRGVDGRAYPWGDRFAHPYTNVRTSRKGRMLPASVFDFPVDCSVYGIHGMAGNVREWSQSRFFLPGSAPNEDAKEQVLRGGCWFFTATGAHLAARYALAPSMRGDTIGFRLFRSVVPEDLAQ